MTERVAGRVGEAGHDPRQVVEAVLAGDEGVEHRVVEEAERQPEPALDVLVTGEDRFDDLPRVMARLADAAGDTLCHRIRYE